MKEGCACISCKIEEAILPLLVSPQGLLVDRIEEAMPAMTRIVGVMLAALDPAELEATWRLMLDARCRALTYGTHDSLGEVRGRC